MQKAAYSFIVLTLLLMSAYKLQAQVDLNNGLVAFYPFNGNAVDESGFNHHPVFNNATLTEDRFGVPNSAYYFNGIDNYMRIKDAPDLNFGNQISIAVWVKPMGFYYGPCHGNSILIKGKDTNPTGRYTIRFSDSQYLNGFNCSITTPDTLHHNYYGGSGASVNGGYTPYVEKDKWVSVVYTYDGINTKMYINCQLVINNQHPGLTFTTPDDLLLGRMEDAPTHPYWFNGAMDDVRLYNRALTEEEVLFIASEGRSHTPLQTITIDQGATVNLSSATPSATYRWQPVGQSTESIEVSAEGLYVVEATLNECSTRDSFRVAFRTQTMAQFDAPDTVCINTPIQISNVSDASSYYWNFCVSDILNSPPIGVNLGNFGGALSYPVFSDFVKSNGNYYLFVVNHYSPSGLVRLDFGNNPLNTPTAHNLGNFFNSLGNRLQGIQVVFDNGKWYAFIVGGDPDFGDSPQFIRLDFGGNIENITPIITDFGNIGSLYHPLDLFMFNENAQWHGFAVNKNGTVTRFSFPNGLDNPATGQNYSIGLEYPVGVNYVQKNGNYYVFVTERQRSSIKRLDFGSSLLNNPTVVNLGNPGNLLEGPADLTIMQFCDNIVGFTINGYWGGKANQLIRLDFNKDIESLPSGATLGNIGNLGNPHSISKLFRVEGKVYSFVTNVGNTPGVNTSLVRLEFPSCSNSNIPDATVRTPSPITYNTPGAYNINLTVDDGLPTQASYCRQVVVMPEPAHAPLQTIIIKPGETVRIGTANPSSTYRWFPGGQSTDSITVTAEGLYIVETQGYGCSNTDSFRVVFQTTAQFDAPDTVCVNTPVQISNVSDASSYYWNFCVSNINETPPTGTNLGNISSALSMPVFMDYVLFNGNYYGFVINHIPGGLVRLDFGNSLLNIPTATNLGNFGGIIPNQAEGVQVVYNEGKWYAIVVGGNIAAGNASIVKVEFGANPANPAPTATNWFNVGNNLDQPIDLHLFQEGNNWFGFTTNSENNTITRFEFGSSFDNAPSGVDLGNIGGMLQYPTGVYAINDEGFWRVFVVNEGTQNNGISSLIRLDFGSSLLNTPTAVNLGNAGNLIQYPRDITLMKLCGQVIGFVVNARINNIVKLNFSDDLTSIPQASNWGNLGNLSFPHSISRLFRVNDNLYTFITNVDNNTITRLEFSGCTNSSISSSTVRTPPPITYNTPGAYNINLTVDDGLPTQSSYCRQVVVVPEPVHTPLQTIIIKPGESVRIGTANPSPTYQWFPGGQSTDSITVTAEGLYIVETQGYGCNNTDSFRVVFYNGDFSFEQDICDPLIVTFKNESPNSTVIDWDFGNGLSASADPNPTTSYPSAGIYTVTLNIINDRGINESATKEIPIQWQYDNLIINNDTVICKDASLQLNAINALSYCWSPAEGLSATNIANPVATPIVNTTYFLNALVPGNNLVVNGDFSTGNSGFSSDYRYASYNDTEGQYFIGAQPQSWNPSLSVCGDHTTSNGNMMMVNGSPDNNAIVWTQTIRVTPNTNYAFSTWIQSLWDPNPAILQFSINGNDMGAPITATTPTCNWTRFYAVWNSGQDTSAIISIVNKNTLAWGNDFALDDISFTPVIIKRDSVVITVEDPRVIANNDTTICSETPIQLNATGAATYAWLPSNDLSNPQIANPIAMPSVNTEYIVTGTTANGCSAKDTVNISLFPKPALSISNDTLVCHGAAVPLIASGGVSYKWFPADGLDNPNIPNPVAFVQQTTSYIVNITDNNACSYEDSVRLTMRPYPLFTASPDATICHGEQATLSASGGDHYQWTPASLVDHPTAPATTASPDINTHYTVYIRENTCQFDTSISVNVRVNPSPVITVQKSNDINCNTPSAQLNASGALTYSWQPASGLDNPQTHNPIATVENTTVFEVTGVNQHGCSAAATITVQTSKDGIPRFVVPNAFTPNNDNLNDCFGIRRWGNTKIELFQIYNRWGQLIFETKNPADCWDGTFKGKPQNAGGYAYVIKAQTLCGSVTRTGMLMLIR